MTIKQYQQIQEQIRLANEMISEQANLVTETDGRTAAGKAVRKELSNWEQDKNALQAQIEGIPAPMKTERLLQIAHDILLAEETVSSSLDDLKLKFVDEVMGKNGIGYTLAWRMQNYVKEEKRLELNLNFFTALRERMEHDGILRQATNRQEALAVLKAFWNLWEIHEGELVKEVLQKATRLEHSSGESSNLVEKYYFEAKAEFAQIGSGLSYYGGLLGKIASALKWQIEDLEYWGEW